MKWNRSARIEQRTDLRHGLLPLPLLLSNLSLLTATVPELTSLLREMASGNVLMDISPPAGGMLPEFAESVAAPPDRKSELLRQLAACPALRDHSDGLSRLLVNSLDDRGLLSVPTSDLADSSGMEESEILALLRSVQDWVEPPGLFAGDIVECLMIQLRRKGQGDGDPAVLLQRARPLLDRGNLRDLEVSLDWQKERVNRALEQIRRLDSSPGRNFASVLPVVPEIDFFIKDGKMSARLLEKNLPRIRLNDELLPWREDPSLSHQWKQAVAVMSALARRKRTMLRIGLVMAEKQSEYLRGVTPAPAPLTMSQIASKLKLSISTVQRTLAATWATTVHGTKLLKDLTSRPLRSRPDLSVAALREIILRHKKSGSSDAAIAREMGLPARTVTWHRNRMKLHP